MFLNWKVYTLKFETTVVVSIDYSQYYDKRIKFKLRCNEMLWSASGRVRSGLKNIFYQQLDEQLRLKEIYMAITGLSKKIKPLKKNGIKKLNW